MLTIITITKDDPEGLLNTIKSIKSAFKNHQVQNNIVDSSNNSNSAMIEKICLKNKLDYFWVEPVGISYAFNYGISKVKNEWVWFLNGGDTTTLNEYSFDLINYLKTTNADVVIFSYINDGKLVNHPSIQKLWPLLFNWIPHPAVIIKTQLLNKIGKFDENFKIAMDAELWFRLFQSKNIITDIVNIPVANFSPGGISSNTQATAVEALKIFYKHRGLIIWNWLQYSWNMFRAPFFFTKNALRHIK